MGGCKTDRVNGWAGVQPIWEVTTDRVDGGTWTSTYMGGNNTDRVNEGRVFNLYGRTQLIGLTVGLGFNLYGRTQLIGLTEGPGLQPIWKDATDRVNGGAWASTYTYGRFQLIGLTKRAGLQPVCRKIT